MHPHNLALKLGVPIMLLKTLDAPKLWMEPGLLSNGSCHMSWKRQQSLAKQKVKMSSSQGYPSSQKMCPLYSSSSSSLLGPVLTCQLIRHRDSHWRKGQWRNQTLSFYSWNYRACFFNKKTLYKCTNDNKKCTFYRSLSWLLFMCLWNILGPAGKKLSYWNHQPGKDAPPRKHAGVKRKLSAMNKCFLTMVRLVLGCLAWTLLICDNMDSVYVFTVWRINPLALNPLETGCRGWHPTRITWYTKDLPTFLSPILSQSLFNIFNFYWV